MTHSCECVLTNRVDPVHQSGEHVEECQTEQGQDQHPGPGHGAKVPGYRGLADVEIPLSCQAKSQPDGAGPEELWCCLKEEFKEEAGDRSPGDGGVVAH